MWELNQEDVTLFCDELIAACDHASSELIQWAGGQGVQSLHDLDMSQGHKELAQMWDFSEPEKLSDGSWTADIFSHAEEMTFFDKTSRAGVGRVTSSKYPIQGKSLLAILEGGAKIHDIPAHNGSTLAFPKPGYEEMVLARSHGIGDYTPGITHKVDVGNGEKEHPFAFPTFVKDHPGVVGNANIEKTDDELEREMDKWCEAAEELVAREMNG